jgi:hypothetical protein
VDTVAPTVRRVVPVENATGIAPSANVSALFSEAVRETSMNQSTFKLYRKGSTTAITASVTYDAATKRAVLNPSANLRRGATYKAVVTAGVRDLRATGLTRIRCGSSRYARKTAQGLDKVRESTAGVFSKKEEAPALSGSSSSPI